MTGVADFPDVPGLWIAGLGASAAVLALLSLITRKNSRHPLLLVGLVALGIMFLSWRILPRTAGERALTRVAGVRHRRKHAREPPLPTSSRAAASTSASLAACAIVGFGLTIVVRRAARPTRGQSRTTTSTDSDRMRILVVAATAMEVASDRRRARR